ncbi:acetyl-CoA carboxylase biotin carboxyl carrier protein [Aestuariivirga sp.]|uniref:acetyl-CoA carboxylase biotin carboxyl carrier protein n=1 Tax=Aestuariivirga sp. TaxID=2650926 RepID=UPI003592FC54
MPPSKKPAAKAAAKPAAKADPDLDLISALAGILNATGLTEIELDRKGTKVRVAKTVNAVATVAAAPAPAVHSHVHVAPSAEAPAPKAGSGDLPGTVKSPMVGTVYLAPGPGAANFIDVGSNVKEGQTLLIIEAMKTMNQIHAPRSGRITHIYVENGRPVEYGEPLVAIE